jgi:hypothetical protein
MQKYMSESRIYLEKNARTNRYSRSVETIVDDLITEIQSKLSTNSTKLKLKQFSQEYKNQFIRDNFFNKISMRDFVQSEMLYIMKGPLTLYALNMNGQVLIDLAGLLERYAIIYVDYLFKSLKSIQLFPDGQDLIDAMLEKKFLPELAKYLLKLGIWNNDDIKKVEKLNKKRNYVAHKNTRKIEAFLESSKTKSNTGKSNISISVLEVDLAMSKFNVLPYMFDTIGLLCKLLDRVSIKSERHRIAQALLDGKIKDESEFFI